MIGFAGGLEFGGTGILDGSPEVWKEIALETWEDKVFCVVLPLGFISMAAESGEEEMWGMCLDWGC